MELLEVRIGDDVPSFIDEYGFAFRRDTGRATMSKRVTPVGSSVKKRNPRDATDRVEAKRRRALEARLTHKIVKLTERVSALEDRRDGVG